MKALACELPATHGVPLVHDALTSNSPAEPGIISIAGESRVSTPGKRAGETTDDPSGATMVRPGGHIQGELVDSRCRVSRVAAVAYSRNSYRCISMELTGASSVSCLPPR